MILELFGKQTRRYSSYLQKEATMNRYDLIVVGGGPGGCAAAKEAADAGMSVLILERGNYCGEKNSSGFGLFPKA